MAVVTSAVLAVTLLPEATAEASTTRRASGAVPGQGLFVEGPPLEGAGELVADDEIGAVVQSRSTGRRVEILSERDKFSQTFVNPDGTRTTELSTGPVRYVDEASGEWRDIDLDMTTVEGPSGDSVVRPQAHALALQLPAGDDPEPPAPSEVSELVLGEAAAANVPTQSLAPVVESGGRQVEVGWPGALPEPVLDGPLATYPDVTPGVDLQVQATTVGYETFMVLNERPDPRRRCRGPSR